MLKWVKRTIPVVMGLAVLGGQVWAADRLPPPPRKTLQVETVLAAPQGLTANTSPDGAVLTWQPVAQASGYVVARVMSPGAPLVAVATLGKDAKGHLDKGQMSAAQYQVVAVSANGHNGAPALATYQPKAPVQPTALDPNVGI